ncbi:MAG TPA: peptidoglycan DD-metalloendopeptidase family protein [Aeromicrobium sp.]|nr:peptidoglycan DD-metalloendopeptidase family protein [Aeromicrobium sp.]
MYSSGKLSVRNTFVAAALSCALIAAFASPGSADSKSDLEKQRSSVNGDIGDAKKSYDQSSKKYQNAVNAYRSAQTSLNSAEAHLSETRGQLAVAEAKDAQMQTQLEASEAALEKALAELKAGEESLNNSEIQVKQFTLESLQEGDRGLRAFGDLLRGANPSTFGERMSLNESVSDAQLATMERLAASKIMLQLNRDKVRKLRDRVALKRMEAAANLEQKKELEASAEKQTDEVGELVQVRSSAKSTANKILADDAEKLRELEAERNRLSARLRALAAKEARKGGGSSAGGDGGSTLSRPVGGYISSSYGMRRHPLTGVYKLHDGTDFGVGCGTPIKAAASGTVIERYYNGGYGNRLIVNHGTMRGVSLVTAYNHATGYIVGVGQHVSRGQTVGYVGSTGYSTGCHLHFMVLANGNTTNPMNWL